MKSESDNIKAIGNEIIRQYDLMIKIQDSHDAKVGIILGFIILILVQIFLNIKSITLCFNDLFSSITLICSIIGFVLILYSGIAGLIAFFNKVYGAGPNADDLIKEFELNKGKDFEKIIYGTINKAYKQNILISKKKSLYIKQMMVCFFIGFMLIIIPNILKEVIL